MRRERLGAWRGPELDHRHLAATAIRLLQRPAALLLHGVSVAAPPRVSLNARHRKLLLRRRPPFRLLPAFAPRSSLHRRLPVLLASASTSPAPPKASTSACSPGAPPPLTTAPTLPRLTAAAELPLRRRCRRARA